LNGKKIMVVLPAYNAAQTLERTVSELDRQVVDDILLVDDFEQGRYSLSSEKARHTIFYTR